MISSLDERVNVTLPVQSWGSWQKVSAKYLKHPYHWRVIVNRLPHGTLSQLLRIVIWTVLSRFWIRPIEWMEHVSTRRDGRSVALRSLGRSRLAGDIRKHAPHWRHRPLRVPWLKWGIQIPRRRWVISHLSGHDHGQPLQWEQNRTKLFVLSKANDN